MIGRGAAMEEEVSVERGEGSGEVLAGGWWGGEDGSVAGSGK